jgi:tRNA threonylcarbamoyladenosine biosynthesis protein TsaE
MKIYSTSPQETIALGQALGEHVQPGDLIVLSGDLGAGKTQLASAFAQGLGVEVAITSPTFAILKHYNEGRVSLNHMDLYRLESAEQLDDLDFRDLLTPDAPAATLIEWGDMFDVVTHHADLVITLIITGADSREIELAARNPRGEELISDALPPAKEPADDRPAKGKIDV